MNLKEVSVADLKYSVLLIFHVDLFVIYFRVSGKVNIVFMQVIFIALGLSCHASLVCFRVLKCGTDLKQLKFLRKN